MGLSLYPPYYLLDKGDLRNYESTELANPISLKKDKVAYNVELDGIVKQQSMNTVLLVYSRGNMSNRTIAPGLPKRFHILASFCTCTWTRLTTHATTLFSFHTPCVWT
ncbi:MAG: hypothetical protein J3Q66DRAFT_337038, partial [Benniella sp.]